MSSYAATVLTALYIVPGQGDRFGAADDFAAVRGDVRRAVLPGFELALDSLFTR